MTGTVALREIRTHGRSRTFRVSTLVTVALIAALMFLPRLFDGDDRRTVAFTGSGSAPLRAAVEQLTAQEKATIDVKTLPDEASARKAVTDKTVDAVVVDGRTLLSRRAPDAQLAAVLQEAHRLVSVEQRLRTAGVDAATVGQVLRVPPLEQVSTSPDGEGSAARTATATVLSIILFMQLVVLATWVAQGVVEEKSNRIVELLLATIRPWQLLAGKIIGLGVLGFAQLALVAGTALLAAKAAGSDLLPPDVGLVVGSALGWFVLAYAFYAALYAAVASLVSRQEELQAALTPASLLMMASYFVGIFVATNPDGSFARVISTVPPFSALVMPVRTAAGPVPGWEIGVALAGMVAATAAMLWLGGRIYRNAVLRTGGRTTIRQALRGAERTAATV
jgi:ABC-2 type transport system permease protein